MFAVRFALWVSRIFLMVTFSIVYLLVCLPVNVYADQHYDFTYPDRAGLIAAGWDFLAVTPTGGVRDTEQTTGAVVSYDQTAHPGILRIPVDVGDLWGDQNNTRNTLLRSLPPNWTSIRLKLSFAPTQNYQQAGLLAYQDDDNYVQVTRIHESGNKVSFVNEINGQGSVLSFAEQAETTDLYLRLDRDTATEIITGWYSLTGTSWVSLGSVTHALQNPRLVVFVGASPGGFPNADLAWAEVATGAESPGGALTLYPGNLVFSASEGTVNPEVQTVNVIYGVPSVVYWALTADAPWINVSPPVGAAAQGSPGSFTISVDPAGLAPGVHTGKITINAPGANNSPQTVNVNLVVKQNDSVQVTTWKGAHKGAMSVWVDDSNPSCFGNLQSRGVEGTYVANGAVPPQYFTAYYNAGMELGSHLSSHICSAVTESVLRQQEIVPNISGICANTPEPCQDVVSMAWPCGFTTIEAKAAASDYFLSARGYNFNMLEEITPTDWMDLKSFNSREHAPYPPADLRTVVDMAVQQGKWANFVFHSNCGDDGAIAYTAAQDIWVAPAGTVAKYILQRDRFILNSYQSTSTSTTFSYSRLSIASSPVRSFETAFGPEDQVTLEVMIKGIKPVSSVTLDGTGCPFTVLTENDNTIVLVDAPIDTAIRTITVNTFTGNPYIVLNPADISFITSEGTDPADQTIALFNSGGGTMSWTATADATPPAWLSVSAGSGAGAATLTVSVNSTGLTAGTYTKNITITAPGAANSPQVVKVTMTVNPIVTTHYDFTYPDRASFIAAGWDFLAMTPSGGSRNTEQTTGAVVSYDQAAHPGILRIPVDSGDLWGDQNNTRNTLLRDLPPDWTGIRLKLSFAPTENYQQAGLLVYQDDDNYVQVTFINNNGNKITFAREIKGDPFVLNSVAETVTGNLYLRLDTDPSTQSISAYYSLDGTSWVLLGSVTQVLSNPRMAIFVGASPGGFPNADLLWAEVDAVLPVPTVSEPLAIDAVSSGSIKNGPVIKKAHTTAGSNRLMLVGVSLDPGNKGSKSCSVRGITYNGTALTKVGTAINSNRSRVEIWGLIAPAAGTHNVVITFNRAVNSGAVAGIMTFTGVNQSTPFGTLAAASGSSRTAGVSVSSATGEVIFGVIDAKTSRSLSQGALQTERWDLIAGDSHRTGKGDNHEDGRGDSHGAGSTQPGAATVTSSWTLGSPADWAIAAVPVKPLTP